MSGLGGRRATRTHWGSRFSSRRRIAAQTKEVVVHGAVMYAPGDVRVEERADPQILDATDAIIRVSAACVCGSDLWPYRGVEELDWPAPMGHEYAGIVEEVG